MEVYFLDVGQGTCNVILLGGRKAIVIDSGPRGADLRKILDFFAVDTIACLAISHLDADHSYGAIPLLTEFRGRIERICYPIDHRGVDIRFCRKLLKELEDGQLEPSQVVRMERVGRPKNLWRDPDLAAHLDLLSPNFAEAQQAVAAEDSNSLSGVLRLKVDACSLVFSGDASLAQWRAIRQGFGRPINCDILAVSHHAGISWPTAWTQEQVDAELAYVYSEAVRATHAVVSVGTNNTHGHPRTDVVRALTANGATVLCTQITGRCCANLESLRPGVIALLPIGRSQPGRCVSQTGDSYNLACAGTVVADLTPAGVKIRRISQHQKAIDRLAARPEGSPLCRR